MSEDPLHSPGMNLMSGASAFEHNAFASPHTQHDAMDEDHKSDGDDSLFVGEFDDKDDEGTTDENAIKLEDDEENTKSNEYGPSGSPGSVLRAGPTVDSPCVKDGETSDYFDLPGQSATIKASAGVNQTDDPLPQKDRVDGFLGSNQHAFTTATEKMIMPVQVNELCPPANQVIPIKDDDDDDLMVIDADDVPAEARAKFAAHSFAPVTPDIEITGVRIKQEPVADEALHLVIRPKDNTTHPDVKDEPIPDDASLFGDVDMPDVERCTRGVTAEAFTVMEDDSLFVDDFVDPIIDDMRWERNVQVVTEDATTRNTPSAESANAIATVDKPNEADQANGVRDISDDPSDKNSSSRIGEKVADETPRHAAASSSSATVDTTNLEGSGPAFGDAGPSLSSGHIGDYGIGEYGEENETEHDNEDDTIDDAEGRDADDSSDMEPNTLPRSNVADDDEDFTVGDDQELSDGELPESRRSRARISQKKQGKQKATQKKATLEDLEDEQLMLQAHLNVLSRRKATDRLQPGDEKLLRCFERKSTALAQKLAQMRRKNMEGLAEAELQKLMERAEESEDETSTRRPEVTAPDSKRVANTNVIPALVRLANPDPAGPSAQKRKWQLPVNPKMAGSNKRRKSGRDMVDLEATTEAILNSIRHHDPIMARAQMNDYQIFDKIEATTVEEQMRKLREQLKGPEDNERKIRADIKEIDSARKFFGGRKYCKAFNGQWKITGLKKPLHHYQLVGAGWMLSREVNQNGGPYGGILADSVGLGKTVEAIACILGNRLPEHQKADGKFGTLVVVPSNLLAQWQDEIDECCGIGMNVVHYHSGKHNRIRMSNIQRADIVVTTYYEVSKAYPKKETLAEFDHLPLEQQKAKFEELLGKIFHIEWHRVILDEAHLIKNHNSHTSKACTRLLSKYRWALTGTPIHNGLHEMYPYMKFLKVADGQSFKDFKARYGKKTIETTERLKSFVGDVMMVRRIDTIFCGRALFDIPRTHPLPNIWINFSEEENLIYRRIEHKIRELLNQTLAADDAEQRQKARQTFFSIAMRLRQATSHPFMLFPMMRDYFEYEDILEIRQKIEAIKLQHPERPFVAQIGTWCEKLKRGKFEGNVTATDREQPFGRGDHGLDFNMSPQFEKLEKMKTMGGTICALCSEPFTRPRKTRCGHVFCLGRLEDAIDNEKNQGNTEIHCITCNAKYTIDDFIDSPGGQGGGGPQSQARSRHARRVPGWNANMPGNDWRGYQPCGDEENAEFLTECDSNVQLTLAPSAKTTVVKDLVLQWQSKHPDDKIIIFTQWIMVGRILGRVLQQEGLDFLYYFGEMSREEKEDNLKVFRTVDTVKVLISSLKCGGQGLNLTCANRIIMIDPWWNSAAEYQGYGRIFRMGQTKETYYVRLLTKNTIDGRMARLQAKKLKEINGVVTDYDSERMQPRLEELAQMFGRVTTDANGKPVVVEEDYDTEDGAAAQNRASNRSGDETEAEVDEEMVDNEYEDGMDGEDGSGGAHHADNGEGSSRGATAGGGQEDGYGIQDLIDH